MLKKIMVYSAMSVGICGGLLLAAKYAEQPDGSVIKTETLDTANLRYEKEQKSQKLSEVEARIAELNTKKTDYEELISSTQANLDSVNAEISSKLSEKLDLEDELQQLDGVLK